MTVEAGKHIVDITSGVSFGMASGAIIADELLFHDA